MSVELSICIAVYNQIELVKKNLSNLVRYKGDNIEIIIQDDCSSDKIEELVLSYNDRRIKYYRNETNVGLDDNIIKSMRNCKSKWAFLLRSSDTLLVDEIHSVIDYTKEHEKVGYVRFSCIDENEEIRIEYPNRICFAGAESTKLHKNLLSHPSGELYNLKYFYDNDYRILSDYLKVYFDNNRKFVIDMLMRHKLILEAGIATSDLFVWKYVYTTHRKDVAQNSAKNGMCIYHPSLQYQRYNCELSYVANELIGEAKLLLIDEIIERYAKSIIFLFKYINRDKEMQIHYNYEQTKFSPCREIKKFKEKTYDFASKYDDCVREYIVSKVNHINVWMLVDWQVSRWIAAVKSRINKLFQ